MSAIFIPYAELDSLQVSIVNSKIDSSLVINGGPSSGRTTILLHLAVRLRHEGKNVLYISPSSLFKRILDYELDSPARPDIDTLSHFLRFPKTYDYIFIDDCYRYSLTEHTAIKEFGKVFVLAEDFSHPFRDWFYLGSDRLSDQELPPTEGIADLFKARVIGIQRLYSSLPLFWNLIRNQHSFTEQVSNCSIFKISNLIEACHCIRDYIIRFKANDVGILSYTRKGVEEAYSILKTLDINANTYLPGKEGIDTFDVNSPMPNLLTIKSSIGLHFQNVFVLPYYKDFDADSFEIAITRATRTITFFYEDYLQTTLSKNRAFLNNNISYSEENYNIGCI